jgi:hypothetical protein
MKQMKKIVIILLTHLWIISFLFPARLAVLPQLEKPDSLLIDDELIVVGDRTSVFIYSAKDYRLLSKFGGQGEGPEQFLPLPGRGLWLNLEQDSIFIHSMGKISYFTRDGKFIKEKRVPQGTYFFRPFADQLLGFKRVVENEIIYETLNLYDNNLTFQKELFRHKDRVQQNRREIRVLDQSVVLEPGREKIFLSASNFLDVLVFDKKGALIYTINNRDEKRREVTDRDRKEIHEFLRVKYGDIYLSTRDMVKIPAKYPVIRSRIGLQYDYNNGNQRLYVITWNKKGRSNICLLYDTAGKFLEKVYLEMKSATPILPFPFIIRNGRFYQLVENEDTGDWELFVAEIN